MSDRLTAKQEAFVEHYCQLRNATEAARRAGYAGDDNSLAVIGYENLRKPKIQDAIQERFKFLAMKTEEAMARLSSQARGPNFLALQKVVQAYQQGGLAAAMGTIEEMGIGPYIKSIYETRNGLRLDLYDSQRALTTILRGLGAFKDHIKIEDMREEAIGHIRAGELTLDALIEAGFDRGSAEDLFKAAGVPIET